ncbi:RagB/SusD family nutrient uptake outer membrane protein [Arcticibacter sp.]|jgi:hypothetical protein|uniref:RagB/SusD family nutrient uptake outer membrane protein n=1 Tax=Arcticibacter sp. TaxID=1872630 RepID=UPI0038906F01
MKSLYKYICVAVLVISSLSCKKYLDVTPENVGTIDYAFRNRNEAENYLYSCYSTVQQLANTQWDVGFATSGEIIFPNDLTDNQGFSPIGFNLIRGTQTSSAPGLNYWDGLTGGLAMFRAIRRCNTMLENIDKPVDLRQDEKERWIAEVKFLKAYYHFYLFKLYGPIPIIDINLPINSSEDEVMVKRVPVDSVVNYMIGLLDEAVPGLPLIIQDQAKELGRITKPIALSVKAQILATAASPLYNGNPDYSDFKDYEGTQLFSTSVDPMKWDRAEQACREAIQMCETIGLKLHTFIPPANITTLSDSLMTVLTLQTAITEKWDINSELVWALNPVFPYQPYSGPRLTAASVLSERQYPGTLAVPLAQQELFYTEHGVPINEDRTWDYANRYSLRVGDNASRFYIENGYETVKAHFNREPRFYADLAFDGGVWFGNGVVNQNSAYVVKARGNSAIAGPKDRIRLNITGYWPKKLVNYLSVQDDGYVLTDFRLPVIRLAGLYLLYSEILNEQGKPYLEVVEYIDRVRKRAGLAGVVDAWTNFSLYPDKFTSQSGMREIIHQETRIELAFEGQPGWDLRRWKKLQNILSQPMQGWNIYETEPAMYYRPRILFSPVFNKRDYLWPIRDYNLIVNDKLVQNPGW